MHTKYFATVDAYIEDYCSVYPSMMASDVRRARANAEDAKADADKETKKFRAQLRKVARQIQRVMRREEIAEAARALNNLSSRASLADRNYVFFNGADAYERIELARELLEACDAKVDEIEAHMAANRNASAPQGSEKLANYRAEVARATRLSQQSRKG